MTIAKSPFPLPARLPSRLRKVLAYWDGLKRGDNRLPFLDDIALGSVPEMEDRLLLLDVFVRPSRFRFSYVGDRIARDRADNIVGSFADEIDAASPFEYILAQCSVAFEAKAPTFYRRPESRLASGDGYSRLLLPMWGSGQVAALFGAVEYSDT